MIPYQKEKIDNAICFFATEHSSRSGNYLTQTFLYKYLAFVDFKSVEQIGIPAFNLEYMAMKKGPVPHKIYNRRKNLETNLYKFINVEKEIYIIKPKEKPNLDFFSGFELEIMRTLIAKYAKIYSTTNDISENSHQDILAWKKTYYDIKKNSIIDYALTFDENLKSKSNNELSQAEENYLTFNTFEKTGLCKSAR